ncbi:hypothetical protein Metal_1634 [Methylomicrobium album BG8]|uniref:Uncharacterized protein n=2 Tax=Methylococcaceae TaxID=403 RepID=H8GM52_METAL|nr:hypothetical protein Metal_1634 [Methylomicrobium album BG8]
MEMKDLQSGQEAPPTQTQETLSLQDLLIDAESDALSDYLALSISLDGQDARVSITTTDAEPTTYSSVFSSIQEIDLQALLANLQADSGQG